VIFSYDTSRWPLREAVMAILELDESDRLEDLHLKRPVGSPPLCPVLLQAHIATHGANVLPESWQEAAHSLGERRDALFRSDVFLHFLELYDSFCTEVLLPLLSPTSATSAAYVQRPPSLRVTLAGQPKANGKIGMHRDAVYPRHHQAEINFWVPVTNVSGNNSLFVETASDRGDFKPLELEYGQGYMFHGYSCRHHTSANDTGVSRVSFDLRAVSALCAGAAEALRGGRRSPSDLRIGDYGAALMSPT
jgi:hypothetical protein